MRKANSMDGKKEKEKQQVIEMWTYMFSHTDFQKNILNMFCEIFLRGWKL